MAIYPRSKFSEKLVEDLASIEHERWSHWQRYLHEQCLRCEDGSLVIPAELVARWEKQMATTYNDLDEQEKESDREQVYRNLPVLIAAVTRHAK